MFRSTLPNVQRVEVDGVTYSMVEDTVASESESPDLELVRRWEGPDGEQVSTYVSRAVEPLSDAVRSRLLGAAVERLMMAGGGKDEMRSVAGRAREALVEAGASVVRVNGETVAGYVVVGEGLRVVGTLVNDAALTAVADVSALLAVSLD